MKYRLLLVAGTVAPLCTGARTSSAQRALARSHSSGFFVGLGVEGDGVSTHLPQSDLWTKAAGGGGGLVLGYGFTPRWSLYSELSAASIDQTPDQGGRYSLRQLDAGVRVHFRTGPSAVVPFAQLGFSGRSMIEHFPAFPSGTVTVESRSSGVGFGGGLNAHFSPAFAFSGSVAWTLGNFDTYKIGGQRATGNRGNATSGRVHLGVVWFPEA